MLILFGLACGGSVADSDAGLQPAETDPVAADTELDEGCASVEIVHDGDGPPLVGDSWHIWLHCDGALLVGPMVLQIEPPELANIDENVATFVQTGSGTLHAQVGTFQQDMDVTIAADE